MKDVDWLRAVGLRLCSCMRSIKVSWTGSNNAASAINRTGGAIKLRQFYRLVQRLSVSAAAAAVGISTAAA